MHTLIIEMIFHSVTVLRQPNKYSHHPLAATGAADAPSVEWYNQPSNQTDAPRTTAMASGEAGPMLDSGNFLDNLWGGKKGKLTDVGDQYDVPQVSLSQRRAVLCSLKFHTLAAT